MSLHGITLIGYENVKTTLREDIATFSLSKDVRQTIQELAKSRGIYMSEVVELAVLRLKEEWAKEGSTVA